MTGTITHLERVGEGENTALLVTYDIPGYGETQPYFYGSNTVDPADRIERSRMPSEYKNKRFLDFEWGIYGENIKAQMNITDAFVEQYDTFEHDGKGLYIYSKCKGSGKTFLACVLANEVVQRKSFPLRFVNSTDFVGLVKSKDPEDQEVLLDIYHCRLLVLDDIGAQDSSQRWINEALFRLIDFRYREKRPVIFTSNLAVEQLKCDDRVIDRIEAMTIPVKMPEVRVRHIIAEASTRNFLEKIIK